MGVVELKDTTGGGLKHLSITADIRVNHGEYLPVASFLKREKALVFERIPPRHIRCQESEHLLELIHSPATVLVIPAQLKHGATLWAPLVPTERHLLPEHCDWPCPSCDCHFQHDRAWTISKLFFFLYSQTASFLFPQEAYGSSSSSSLSLVVLCVRMTRTLFSEVDFAFFLGDKA